MCDRAKNMRFLGIEDTRLKTFLAFYPGPHTMTKQTDIKIKGQFYLKEI